MSTNTSGPTSILLRCRDLHSPQPKVGFSRSRIRDLRELLPGQIQDWNSELAAAAPRRRSHISKVLHLTVN